MALRRALRSAGLGARKGADGEEGELSKYGGSRRSYYLESGEFARLPCMMAEADGSCQSVGVDDVQQMIHSLRSSQTSKQRIQGGGRNLDKMLLRG